MTRLARVQGASSERQRGRERSSLSRGQMAEGYAARVVPREEDQQSGSAGDCHATQLALHDTPRRRAAMLHAAAAPLAYS